MRGALEDELDRCLEAALFFEETGVPGAEDGRQDEAQVVLGVQCAFQDQCETGLEQGDPFVGISDGVELPNPSLGKNLAQPECEGSQ